MTRTTISFRVEESLSIALDALANDLGTSKSQVARDVLREQIIDRAELSGLPEHLVISQKREQMKEQNRIIDLREGFEGRTKKQLHSRYYSGDYDAESIEAVAENYHREISILWPEWSDEDYSEERADRHAFVEQLVEQYRELDETLNSSERELDGGTSRDDLRDDAEYMLFKEMASGEVRRKEPEEVVRLLSMRPDVSLADARSVVDDLTGEDISVSPEVSSDD